VLVWLPGLERVSLSGNLLRAAAPGLAQLRPPLTRPFGRPFGRPLGALRQLDLSFNLLDEWPLCFPPWLLKETQLQGLSLDGNGPALTAGALLALEGASDFVDRRNKTKNKGQGGCW